MVSPDSITEGGFCGADVEETPVFIG